METHDFTNAKIGDKVSHPFLGNGIITEFVAHPYALRVMFDKDKNSFTKNGYYYESDKSPSLYHGHNTFQIIATPVSPYKEGEWIAVRNFEDVDWQIRQFIKIENDRARCVSIVVDQQPFRWNFHKSISELNSELNNL